MAFGPRSLVTRSTPRQYGANQVRLGEFDPDHFPLLPSCDPMSHFIDSVVLSSLKTRTSANRFFNAGIRDAGSILWGIMEEDRPVGFATLALSEQDSSLCGYTIVLHPSARHRGLGGFATAGVVQTGFEHGALHAVSDRFDVAMSAIDTAIHHQNLASQKICQRAGFVPVEGEYEIIAGIPFQTYLCEQPVDQGMVVSRG